MTATSAQPASAQKASAQKASAQKASAQKARARPDRAQLASVRNAARVLRAFSRAGQELGITELSRQLGLGKSTVHRLGTTLTAERLLERGSTAGRYRLGP